MVTAVLCVLALAGCGSRVTGTAKALQITDVEHTLVTSYFTALNEAGTQGVTQQRELLADTQHPDFREGDCELPDGTIRVQPTMSTLRLDPDWTPPGQDEHPRGVVVVVAVTLTVVQDGIEIGSQIGSQHLVLLNGKTYGFAPCAT
ncbi:putative secreted protein [Saccharothrix espanaensis DSM 44229]|uniref:Putative secreted protein n=1 Tax=Saccharothrix espanaensis (strain ATCC 51144 / DSM 44229 / JCM 9112 / NBRC 15066 / NRRL 15764) TaxID=1179773 RepID=K0KAU2_SACES|nr:putative secreted protein [Saccharothrix espanaensis DSM 44229]